MVFRSPHPDAVIPELPLHTFVLERAGELAEKAALVDGPSGRTLTYGQLAAYTGRMASALAQRGFQKGDVFAIFASNLPEYAVAMLAVASLGGICTTINPLYTVEELTFQLNDTGAIYLLTIPQFIDKAREAASASNVREIIVLGAAEGATPFAALLQNEGQAPAVAIDPHEDLVVLPYSSGTTGLPKGVMLTHHSFIANVCQIAQVLDTNQDDTVIAVLPFYHIYGMTVILATTLRQGGTVVTMPRFDLEQFLSLLRDYNVTIAPVVPPIIIGLAKHPLVEQYRFPNLRFIGSGAAPLAEPVERACVARMGCPIVQGYGMTETSAVTHINPMHHVRPGSVGVLLPSTEGKIVNPASGAELGVREQGEVCVRGPQIMRGYLNRRDATDAMLDSAGWLHTGDVGYMDEDGYLYVVDRVKELIKYKGLQVAPAELEAVLLTHPAIADAAVIPRPDEEAGEVPKAYVVLKPNAYATENEMMAFVAEKVAPHKKVRYVEIVEQVPKSASGKILRRVLIEQERMKAAQPAV